MPICPKCLEHEFAPPLEAWDQDPDGFCLLHSKVNDKDQAKFTELLDKKKNQADYNFSSVFFPEKVSFRGFSFTK
jgi:hypothetical protein